MNTDSMFSLMIDIGSESTIGSPRYRKRNSYGEGPDAAMKLRNVRENLSRLTSVIPATNIKDMLEVYQRQVVGVPGAWVRYFRRLVTLVTYYHQGQCLGDP